MKLSKLNRRQTIALGIVILIVIGVGGYFALIKDASERYQAAVKDRDDAKVQTERVPGLEMDRDRVQAEHTRAERRLRACYAAKMPAIDISLEDPVVALGRLWIEYGDNGMGPVLLHWVRGTGNWASGVSLPDVRTDPPPRDTKQVEVDLQNFGITTKSFPTLLAFLRVTGDMPRLGSIRKIKVSKASDRPLRLSVELPMTVYLWTTDFTRAAPGPTPTQAAQAGPASGAPPGAR